MNWRCAFFGHSPVITSSVPTHHSMWVQQTCIRCGATRQYTTHRWGRTAPTPWATK